jgi:hypothetical protein
MSTFHPIVEPTVAVVNYLGLNSFRDVGRIETLIHTIKSLEKDPTFYSEKDAERAKNPKYISARKAMLKRYKNELEKLKTHSSFTDGMQPILILMGDESMIRREVIDSFKSMIVNDCNYGWDIEYREVDPTLLTKDFAKKLPKPTGKDGGLIIVPGLSRFLECCDDVEQIQILINVMINPLGAVTTGWRIVFIEDTDDKEMNFPEKSFLTYFSLRNILYHIFVESNK